MSIEQMEKYQKTGKCFKLKAIKQFWDTHPTNEQETLRKKITYWALLIGFLFGAYCTIGTVLIFWMYYHG